MAVNTAFVGQHLLHDDALIMKSAGLIAASAAVATIIDLGPGTGYRIGCIELNITAIEINNSDELFDIVVQGSASSTFATASGILDLASIPIADDVVTRTDSEYVPVAGVRRLYFDNVGPDGTMYRYIRLYTVCAGTVGTGINYSARLSFIPQQA